LEEIGYSGYIIGNALQSISKNNAAYISFTNTFDAGGNLIGISYLGEGVGTARPAITEHYTYRP
jgi:hypothetical protein